jgi:hypothetical protein
MKYGVAILALVMGLPPQAQASCIKPDVPACAIARIPFPSDVAADDCRKDMLRFRDAMDTYASCRGQVSKGDEAAARDAYEDVRVRFNQRARGDLN